MALSKPHGKKGVDKIMENKLASRIALEYLQKYKDMFNRLHQLREKNIFLDTRKLEKELETTKQYFLCWNNISRRVKNDYRN